MFRKPADVLLRQHLAAEARSAGRRFAQAGFTLACLPYEAFFGLDAIVRTAGRMLFTHRRLLEWRPSGTPDRNRGEDLAAFFRAMWIAPVIAAAVAIHLVVSRPVALETAGPVLALWFASPVIAWWISRPLARRRAALSADQILFLRKLSRRTWAFFETFVGPEDHWLPPDNYQEYRHRARSPIARRRPTWGFRFSRTWPPATSDTFCPGNSSSARRMRCARWRPWRGIEVISTTGTTRNPWNRCCRSTSRRWTAETSRATC